MGLRDIIKHVALSAGEAMLSPADYERASEELHAKHVWEEQPAALERETELAELSHETTQLHGRKAQKQGVTVSQFNELSNSSMSGPIVAQNQRLLNQAALDNQREVQRLEEEKQNADAKRTVEAAMMVLTASVHTKLHLQKVMNELIDQAYSIKISNSPEPVKKRKLAAINRTIKMVEQELWGGRETVQSAERSGLGDSKE